MNTRLIALFCALFLAAGNGGLSTAFGAAISSSLTSLTRSGSVLVALSSAGNLERSTDDGASFTITRAASTTALLHVGASGATVVAVGDAGYVVRSTTAGQVWTDATSASFPGELRDVAGKGGGFWVAVGRNNLNVTILWSADDGSTWTAGTVPSQSGTLRGVAYDATAGRWIAVGTDGLFGARLLSSSDGKVWTAVTLPAGTYPLTAIATDGQGRELAVGEAGTLLFSPDGGQTFTADAKSGLVSENLNTVIYMTSTGWYAGGDQQVQITYATGSGPSVVQAPINGGGPIATLSQDSNGNILVAGTLIALVPQHPSRLVNLSIRVGAGAGVQTLIVGFVASGGTGSQASLLVRAGGPALTPLGVPGAMPDPMLSIKNASGTEVAFNDNWGGATAVVAASVGAYPFTDVSSKDAAISLNLTPAPYTAVISGGGAVATGVVLAEIYDTNTSFDVAKPVLLNVSARAQVDVGANIMITGFVIAGDTPLTVLIRAVGPTLADLGVTGTLVDPQLTLYRGATAISSNDNWDSSVTATAAKVGAFALRAGSKDAALWVTLNPGVYTAQVSGVGNTTGVALVEVYAVP